MHGETVEVDRVQARPVGDLGDGEAGVLTGDNRATAEALGRVAVSWG